MLYAKLGIIIIYNSAEVCWRSGLINFFSMVHSSVSIATKGVWLAQPLQTHLLLYVQETIYCMCGVIFYGINCGTRE